MLFSHFVVDDNFVRSLPSRYTVGLPASERSYHGNEDKDNDVLGAGPVEFSDWNLKDFSIPPSFEKYSYHRQQNERKKMRQSEE